jgi:hypothetical protein
MDIPKKLANQVTQDKGKQNKSTTQYCNMKYIECTSPAAIIHPKHLREDKLF